MIHVRIVPAVLALCVLLAAAGAARAVMVTISDPQNLPHYQQLQNFGNIYATKTSDVVLGNVAVAYPNLATAMAGNFQVVTRVNETMPKTNGNWRAGQLPSREECVRDFTANDFMAMTNGAFHCYPTVAAMLMQYWSTKKDAYNVLGIGNRNEVDYIDVFAEAMDTNDQNPALNANRVGHFGTFNTDLTSGLRSFARNEGLSVILKLDDYDFDKYKRQINNDRPVMIIARNPGESKVPLFHGVVGYGFDSETRELIVRDPAQNQPSTTVQDPVGIGNIQGLRGANGGVRFEGEGDFEVTTFDPLDSLIDAAMLTLVVVPEPSSCLLGLLGALMAAPRRCRRMVYRLK